MIKAVAMDMDGLMFDTEALALEGWKHVGEQLGIDIPESLIMEMVGLDVDQSAAACERHYGCRVDFDSWRKMRIRWVWDYIEANGMPVKPGLMELLGYLKERGYLSIVATSSHRYAVDFYFEKAGLTDYFDQIVSAEAVRLRKPDPAIYRKASEMLGVRPEQCMALEDSPVGILAACRAGMKPVMIPDLIRPDKETEKLLYACVNDLTEVIPLLERDRQSHG
ncbi:HAD family phosphatase [Anaerolentibacter hominis]|uniref:HAD family hydrolase n=1 Tax=Anaerolentibacter hominis TaxID=3079009 RepID=UPI0031B8483F